MKLEGYKSSLKAYRKLVLRYAWYFVAGLVGISIPGMYLIVRINRPSVGNVIFGLFFAVLIAGGIVGSFAERRLMRRFGLLCPACHRSLVPTVVSQILVASGRCGHCGAQVLEA
jgi:hypothetical protein